MKKCVFCPIEATKLSGEHIWDDWLNRRLPTTRFQVRKRLTPKDPFREYEQKRLNEKLPVVCESCNNGWMSDITGEIRNGFADAIIHASECSILPRGLALLSAFTFMKAVVADCITQSDGDELFFSIAARERFRKSLAIPNEVQMWVACFYGSRRYAGRFVSGILRPDPGPLYGIEFFTFTYVVGHLALQLLAARWRNVRLRGRPLPVIKPHVYWHPAVARFWPTDGTAISWPLKYIGDNTIEQFIYRFNAPINLPVA